jgi:uncharacterized metal-binding protein YceD (DUF177 family)
MTAEFSRTVRIDTLGAGARTMTIEADEAERVALAERLGLVSIESLVAEVALSRADEAVTATGMLKAAVTQSCVATAVPVPATVEEPFTILFRPQPKGHAEEEIELSEQEMDVVFYDGAMVDIGDAVAESLSLGLDPYPRAPDAEAVLREVGVKSEDEMEAERVARSPFAALRKE